MSFANISPADRMKVSALCGLIVVIVFFIVHTLLGAMAPQQKKRPAPGQTAKQEQPATPADAHAPLPNEAPAVADEGLLEGAQFVQATPGQGLKDNPELQPLQHDPFTPLREDKQARPPASEPNPDAGRRAPSVSVGDSRPVTPALFGAGNGGGLPGMFSGGTGSGATAAMAVLPPPEPPIKLIGIVHGDPSVVTVQVQDRVMLARPGDMLARGYWLHAITPESAVIRHKKANLTLRVGGLLNEPAEKPGN